ncbi:hypothetical protein BE221DRAFT_201427 [Ostreococcus tauri]|uniref:Uncharacterized protein n=1 Tax=Ostreococcus tauri TaxID=70448 RepID=A0A1Y5I5Z9_OSTTA|nr:hypothetical protein BE221DRAFT_201427 [Ostreococcus tauri]
MFIRRSHDAANEPARDARGVSVDEAKNNLSKFENASSTASRATPVMRKRERVVEAGEIEKRTEAGEIEKRTETGEVACALTPSETDEGGSTSGTGTKSSVEGGSDGIDEVVEGGTSGTPKEADGKAGGGSHGIGKDLKRVADAELAKLDLKKKSGSPSDASRKLRVMKLYVESAIHFVDAAARRSDELARRDNFRDDVQFARYVDKVCSMCYASEVGDVDFKFRCTALRALTSRLACACAARVLRYSERELEVAAEDVEKGRESAEAVLVRGVKDAKVLTECMRQAASHVMNMKSLVPRHRDDAVRVCEIIMDFASDCGSAQRCVEIADEAHEALEKITSMKPL